MLNVWHEIQKEKAVHRIYNCDSHLSWLVFPFTIQILWLPGIINYTTLLHPPSKTGTKLEESQYKIRTTKWGGNQSLTFSILELIQPDWDRMRHNSSNNEVVRKPHNSKATSTPNHSYQQEHTIIDIYCVSDYILHPWPWYSSISLSLVVMVCVTNF